MTTLKEASNIEYRMKVHSVVMENLLLEYPEINREAASKLALRIVEGRSRAQLEKTLSDNT